MSESKHTPGPWQRHGSHIYTADPERAMLAQVFNPGKRPEDYPLTENANLMAAAPDLLDELEVARDFIQQGIELGFISTGCAGAELNMDSIDEMLDKFEEAIKKARGLQQ